MKNIVVLISGRGSNMRAIVQACAAERWNARVAAVISNRSDAAGLLFAREQGLQTDVVDHRDFDSRERFDAHLAGVVGRHSPDAVALAGFMRILTPTFVRTFEGRLLNVHPSLLPAFTGLHTHRRVLEAGCKLSGATVHFVTSDLDHGPIIAQAAVPVLATDDETTLAARVVEAEHVLYPRAMRWLIDGNLQLRDGVVRHSLGHAQLLVKGRPEDDSGGAYQPLV